MHMQADGRKGVEPNKTTREKLAILPYIHGSTSPSNLLSYHLLPYCTVCPC